MENNLLSVVKSRVMSELTESIQRHQLFRDNVEVYHKFPYKERPMMGVVLRNTSSSRIKLSADDHAGTLKSHIALARAENHEGAFLDWVWEDFNNLTKLEEYEDLSSQVTGTNRFFNVSKQMISGYNNTKLATNSRQITVMLNGVQTIPEYVNGSSQIFSLTLPPPAGSTLNVSYYYNNLVPPGRYYIEISSSTEFIIDPFYVIKDEVVIEKTTGLEIDASLEHGNIYGNFDTIYTRKMRYSTKIYLEKNVDYSLAQDGTISFIGGYTLEKDTTLYASYRYVGDTLGPFTIPDPFHYNNEALPGILLCFNDQVTVGDKLVVLVYPDRESAAEVKSGHYQMSFEIDVFTRDPQQLAELTDHLISDIWGNIRQPLIDEGLTIEEMDPTGESEEPYDENTGDLYYKNSISLQMMTEWKKFVPFLVDLLDFDTKLYAYLTNKDYIITNQGRLLELFLVPNTAPLEVKYPKIGYARYF
jgi:hypothetical protein